MSNFSQEKQSEKIFWDKVARERIYAAFDEPEYLDVFEKAFGTDLTGKSIVDVGCASGVSAAILASRGANVVGVDISSELIQQAKQLWTEHQNQIHFIVGDAEHLDMAKESADACFFGGVLHHFPNRAKIYEEALRILRPEGKFVALEPNLLDFFELIEWNVAGFRGKLSPNEYPINPNEMMLDLETAGFRNVNFWTIRHDIPVLAQFPLLKHFFNRQRGFWLKRPIMHFTNAFREPDHRGTFFVIQAIK